MGRIGPLSWAHVIIDRGAAALGRLRQSWRPGTGTLMVFGGGLLGPTNVRQRFLREVGGIRFMPVDLGRLESMKKAADTVFGHFGLEVVDIAENTFVPQVRKPGEITDLDGEIAPRTLAGNAIGAIAVTLAGAETGSAANYKEVKQRTDGIGADAAARAERLIGDFVLEKGRYRVMVATEGTGSHPKPDEPAIGNPTIPRGRTFPAVRDLKRGGFNIRVENGIPVVAGLRAIFLGKDVIEGTEIASTSPAAFRLIAGRDKDNGACTVSLEADHWPVTADTYMDKVAISREVVEAINRRGATLNINVGGDTVETIKAIAEAAGIPLSELGVICLGLKPRWKIKDGQRVGDGQQYEREGRKEMLMAMVNAGISVKTIDDGETPALRTLAVGNEIEFNNDRRGRAHVFVGPGGVFESMTLARAVRDSGGDGWWCYIDKGATKKVATYGQRTTLSAEDRAELKSIGIADPSRSRNISEDVADSGDRMLIVTSFTPNPLNPQAIPVEIDEQAGTIVFYQEVFSSDGSVRGLLWKLKAVKDITHVKKVLSPVIPDLMALTDLAAIRPRLDEIASTPEGLAAIRSGLLSYLYYYISENTEAGADFTLSADNLKARVLASAERRDFEVLLWATEKHPDWFTNPGAVAEALTTTGDQAT